MFDIGWSEIALIAIVALIFIGPKELPAVLRNVGKWVTAARGMAREFQGHVDDLVRETELDEVRRNIRENASATLNDLADHIDPDRSLREGLDPDKLVAGDAANKPTAEPVDPLVDPLDAALPVIAEPALAEPSSGEIAAVAAAGSEPLGTDYHPPSDMAPAATAPIEAPKDETVKAAVEPAKNAGVAEPGRA